METTFRGLAISGIPERRPRLLPLALIISAIFGAAATPIASAATLLVTDCGDGSSSGTLRNTIAVAPDNSIIEIPLMCSKITLDQGAIHIVGITSMYIVGQSPSATIIAGSSMSLPITQGRLFEVKQTTGTLGFNQLTLEGGHYVSAKNPRGGCVYSTGNVGLNNAVVTECGVNPYGGTLYAEGGGIFAQGAVTLFESMVTNNAVVGAPGATSRGGGISAVSEVDATSSTISGNRAIAGPSGPLSRGGGFFSIGFGNSTIKSSTISGNIADTNSAAELRTQGSATLSIINSTIAYNYAFKFQALGAYLHSTVTNSTIAFNGAIQGSTSAPVGMYSPFQIAMYSSIFANNLAESGVSVDVASNADGDKLIGSENLITATANTMPPGTLTACPRLGHLSDNGGRTQTLPLLLGSPALDAGGANGQSTDQRGTGFPRTVGPGTDIGAYERQVNAVDDEVFFGRFELRCD